MSTQAPNAGSVVDSFKQLWEIYVDNIKKYVEFKGRSPRRVFWAMILFNVLISIPFGIIDGVIGWGSILGGLFSLAVLLPTQGVYWRRLHDLGKSGWYMGIFWIAVAAIVIIAIILGAALGAQSGVFSIITGLLFLALGIYSIYLVIIMGFFKSQSGENQYGANPYGE